MATTKTLGFTTGTVTVPTLSEFPIGAKLRFTIGYNEEWVKEKNPANSLAICVDTTRIYFGTKCIGGPAVTEYETAVEEGFEGTFSEWIQQLAEDALGEEIDSKQDELVSGTNIKTINGETLLGEGDIVIESADAYTKTETDALLAKKAAVSHTHTISNVTGLGAALDAKQDDLSVAQLEAVNSGITAQTLDRLKASVDKKIEGATINGTDLTITNNKVAIPLTSASSAGVVIVPTISTSELSNYAENAIGSYTGTVLPKIATSSSYGVVKVDEAMSTTSANPVQNKAVKEAIDTKQDKLSTSQLNALRNVDKFFLSELILNESTYVVGGTTTAIKAAHQAMADGQSILIQCSSNGGLYIPTSPHMSGSTACFSFVHMGKSYTITIDTSEEIVTTYQDISNVQSKLNYYSENTETEVATISSSSSEIKNADCGIYVDDTSRIQYGTDVKVEALSEGINITTGSTTSGTINITANVANYNGSEIVNDDYMGSALETKADTSTVETLSGQVSDLALNKADKATTLSGYGIGDAYTTTQTETAISTATSGKADKATTLAGYGITDGLTSTAYVRTTDTKTEITATNYTTNTEVIVPTSTTSLTIGQVDTLDVEVILFVPKTCTLTLPSIPIIGSIPTDGSADYVVSILNGTAVVGTFS